MINFNKKRMSAIALAFLSSQAVNAALYVAPQDRDNVSYQKQPNTNENVKRSYDALTGISEQSGEFLMRASANESSGLLRYGKNVPLFVAIENVVPDSDDWYIHIDGENLKTKTVSWEGGRDWEDVLAFIGEQNNLLIYVNHNEKAIGISTNATLAESLAKKAPDVWTMSNTRSLRENLADWSEQAGWTLDWGDNPKDYTVKHTTTLTGEFVGTGGVVHKVLASMKSGKNHLKPYFYKGNKVLVIREAGYKQEVSY